MSKRMSEQELAKALKTMTNRISTYNAARLAANRVSGHIADQAKRITALEKVAQTAQSTMPCALPLPPYSRYSRPERRLTMPDPWLTDDGKLHPAAEWGGMPEWVDSGRTVRLVNCGGVWFVEYDDVECPKGDWVRAHGVTPHEAAALLEKDKREKLAEQRIHLSRWASGRWSVHRWVPYEGGSAQDILWSTPDGYTWETPDKPDENVRLAEFPTYTAALQAACMAAKGDDDG